MWQNENYHIVSSESFEMIERWLYVCSKNHQRAIDSMQLSLETETRNKIEALKIKKKLEQDISELEIALELSNKSKIEVEKSFKKYQQQIKDFQQLLDEEQRLRYAAREELAASERKAQLLAGELEEMKAQLDVFERNRKIVEGELTEATDRISELTLANTGLTAAKKKLEVDIQALNVCDRRMLFVIPSTVLFWQETIST